MVTCVAKNPQKKNTVPQRCSRVHVSRLNDVITNGGENRLATRDLCLGAAQQLVQNG